MIGHVLFASWLWSIESLKLLQHSRPRIARGAGVSQCKDTGKADEFYTATRNGLPANGKRVGEWREMYPTWSFEMLDQDSLCMLQGDNIESSKTGVQVVLDFMTPNGLGCCKKGETTNSHQEFLEGLDRHRINSTRFDFTVIESKEHEEKSYFYEVAVPESCQPGGTRAPCPLLVSLHGMALDHLPHMAMECSDCMDDMGVVTALLYMPDAVSHERDKYFHVINRAWDSALWVGEDYVRPVTQRVMNDFSKSIDETRVYLFGLSMGGAGALMDAIIMPDLFNEAYVVSPSSFEKHSSKTLKKIKDEDWKSLYTGRKGAGSGTLKKIYIFSGNDDLNGDDIDLDLLPRSLAAAGLENESIYVEYRMFNYAHDCWLAAFESVYKRLWKGE